MIEPRVLVTRSKMQASVLAGELKQRGAEPVVVPVMEMRPPVSFDRMDTALERLNEFSWVLFTSANGVKVFGERLAVLGLTAEVTAGTRIAVIGSATAKAVEELGLKVDVIPEKATAEGLVNVLRHKVRALHVLLVRAAVGRDVLPDSLRAAGAHLECVEAYQNVVPKGAVEELRRVFGNEQIAAVTFTSSSSVRNLVELMNDAGLRFPKDCVLASIGPITSATLKEYGLKADVEAQSATVASLADAVITRLQVMA